MIDSDDSDGEGPSNKKALIDSDASDTEKAVPWVYICCQFLFWIHVFRKKKFAFDDDSDDEGGSKKEPATKALFGDDSDDDDDLPKKAVMDDLDELVQGQPDVDDQRQISKAHSDSDDEDRPGGGQRRNFEWDFDKMLAEKKAERKKKTRRGGKDGGIDIINDDDGLVLRLTERMKAAAKSDRNANVERKPAFQKIKMLPEVKAMMLKVNFGFLFLNFQHSLSGWNCRRSDRKRLYECSVGVAGSSSRQMSACIRHSHKRSQAAP